MSDHSLHPTDERPYPDWALATFRPKRLDDLSPAAAGRVGRTAWFLYMGVMDEGPYVGEDIWMAPEWRHCGWCPASDLVALR